MCPLAEVSGTWLQATFFDRKNARKLGVKPQLEVGKSGMSYVRIEDETRVVRRASNVWAQLHVGAENEREKGDRRKLATALHRHAT